MEPKRLFTFLFLIPIFLFGIGCEVLAQGNGGDDNDDLFFNSWAVQPLGEPNPVAIPPLIDSRENGKSVEITLQKGSMEFFAGVSNETFGFNGNFLGPTIRLYEGDDVNMKFTNQIGEVTTVHGHGLHVPGNIDGGPQLKIGNNATWEFTLPVRQQASTNWYHPHLMGKTAEHVYKGLAGLYLIEDSNSQTLSLPKEYGIDDIPLVIQDRLFSNGKMNYFWPDMEEGYRGNVILVNGTVNPYLEAPKGLVRLRLLNGSNARFYNFRFSDGRSFEKIATDGGFLESPVALTSMVLAPGERGEIIVDLSNGQQVNLVTVPTYNKDTDDPLFRGSRTPVKVLEIRVDGTRTATGTLPGTLNSITPYQRSEAVTTRSFFLNMDNDGNDDDEGWNGGGSFGSGMGMTNMMGINGRAMDMNYINERVAKGNVELWRITGEEMAHPFHIHGTSFQVLTVGGVPVKPENRGWKDTVIVREGKISEFLVKFEHTADDANPYMYHCHILEHEDMGMMGQFTVE